MRYINVLVVNGEPFNNDTATGITMSNLFKNWPRERIFQIYTANVPPDVDLCKNNIKLSSRNLKPFSFFRRLPLSHSPLSSVSEPIFQTKASAADSYFSTSSIQNLRKCVTPFLDFLPYEVPKPYLKALQDFKPDVIYSMLGSIRMVRLVATLAKRFNIPVVPHFMDDWVSTYSVPGRSIGSPLHVKYLQKAVMQLFDSVPFAMSIGELMSQEYKNKYSREFFDFMNPVEVKKNFPRLNVQSHSGIVRFTYVGGLHLGRAECLNEVANVIQRLKDDGLSVELCIYAPLHDACAASQLASIGDAVIYKGSVHPEDVGSVLEKSDVAVHVESFVDSCAEYTRLSVSTKIPQYFAAGVPVLAYGPSNLASCQYVRSTGAGILVDQRCDSSLEATIRTLVIEYDTRRFMGLRAWARAIEFHEGDTVRLRFKNILFSATGKRVWGL